MDGDLLHISPVFSFNRVVCYKTFYSYINIMVDDAFDVDKFMDQIQDTTECADSSVLSQFATDLNDNPSSVTAIIETSAEDEIINAGSNPDFYEDEPDAELYKVPNREIFEKFPDCEQETESHDVATSSFSDGYNIGEMLLAMSLESGTAYDPPEFETRIADVKYKIIQFINLNKLEKKTKKLFNLSPEQTPTLVVDVDDDSITSRYEDRFAKFESQMNKLSEQCVVANAETAKCKKQNKLLQEENAKLNESLKQGIIILLI